MSNASKIILLAYIPLFATLAAALGGVQFPAWLPYPWLKTLHVLGAVLFLGNMLTGPVWLSIAIQNKEKKMLEYAFRLLRLTDLAFTLPGIFLMIITGVSMVQNWGGIYGQAWVWQSVVLVFVMWALSFPVLFFQEKLYRIAVQEPLDEPRFNKYLWWWSWTGMLVMLSPFVVLYLMVAKEGFW